MLEKSRAVLVAKNLVITDDLFDYEHKTTVSVTEMNTAYPATLLESEDATGHSDIYQVSFQAIF